MVEERKGSPDPAEAETDGSDEAVDGTDDEAETVDEEVDRPTDGSDEAVDDSGSADDENRLEAGADDDAGGPEGGGDDADEPGRAADGPDEPDDEPDESTDGPDDEADRSVRKVDRPDGEPERPDPADDRPAPPAEEPEPPDELPHPPSHEDGPDEPSVNGPEDPPRDGPDEPPIDDPDDAPVYPDGPPDDQEMPLTEHIEEMVLRLAAVLAIAGVITAIAFPFAQDPITFIWYSILPGDEIAQPRVYGPLELKLTELKFASLAGLIAAMPMAVYQTYRFMRPGLYPHERRYYLAAIPTSLILAFIGVAFAFFIVLPAIFTYFMYYSENAADIAFGLQETFNLIIIMKGFMAITFQIPLLIMLAVMMGVTTRRWLQNRRLYFWAGFLGVAFIFSPDPTGMAPIMVAGTMVVLFEGTLKLLQWTGN